MNIPTIDPSWRTATVIELCVSMREAQDFSALPILADALQDAGCPETSELLAELRSDMSDRLWKDWQRARVLTACVLTDEARGAIDRITEIADALGGPHWYGDMGDGSDDRIEDAMTFETLLDAGKSYVEDIDSSGYSGFYIQMGNNEAYKDEGVFPEKEFWRCYQLLTGTAVKDDEASFFSCSC